MNQRHVSTKKSQAGGGASVVGRDNGPAVSRLARQKPRQTTPTTSRSSANLKLVILFIGACCISSWWLFGSHPNHPVINSISSGSDDVVTPKKSNLRKNKPSSTTQQTKRQHLPKTRNGLKTSDWKKFNHRKLKTYFGCDKLFEKPRPLITKREWIYFRHLYNQHVEEEQQNVGDKVNKDVSYKMGKDPFDTPVEGAFTPGKGRGLIASRDIAKGELIFTGSNNTIVFTTGDSWRNFVWYLGHAPPPPQTNGVASPYVEGFACDILAWSWNQRIPDENGPMQAVVDIDESSLLNSPSSGEDPNIQCGRDEDDVCGMDYYAKVDIKKGDEIVCRYSDFSTPSWKTMGL
mmetsp:Transcript_4248/g.8167  ORF Transcript_4248/g.8167 Transcript_4248/m.8167 type:complete len:347 (-) Transcript_4248:195-1235(-)